jgi:uncharacterized protein YjbJ (UPF0337 family)
MSTATEHTIKGKFDEVAGKVKQTVGEALHNDKQANEGAAQQVKGHAEQAWGAVKGAAEDKAAEFKATHQPEAEQKGHDIRESITSTAANVKNHIQNAIHGDHEK